MISLLWQIQHHKSTISIYAGLRWNELDNMTEPFCAMCTCEALVKRYTNNLYICSTYNICKRCYEYVLVRNVIGKNSMIYK